MKNETSSLELKQQITDTFLKTVSAFANYGGGKIIFGVADDGTVIGLDDIDETMLSIENKINNLIDPTPNYTLTNTDEATIVLEVSPGQFKPYLYKNKAYKRSDTSTMQVGRLELTRLILEGSNQDFEELPSRYQDLTFRRLEEELIEHVGVSSFNFDTLKTLQLMSPDGIYNNAAALIADANTFPGIDIAVFGETEDEIRYRKELSGVSIISQFHEAMAVFRQYYVSEVIQGQQREEIEKIPEKAFREAIANALVHRVWDTKSHIRVAFREDSIVVSSPGALPDGISFEEYLDGQLSLLRNPIVGTVFFRLGYIEKFGTCIARINREYEGASFLPTYKETNASITVTLPVIRRAKSLSKDELEILDVFSVNEDLTRAQIQDKTGFSRDKTIRILGELANKGALRKIGQGRSVHYRR